MTSDSRTAPLRVAPSESRSGWMLRLLFVAVFGAMAVTAVVATSLVAGTLSIVVGTSGPAARAEPIGRLKAVGQTEATPAPAIAAPNVWDQHGPLNILLLGLDTGECGETTHTKATRTDTIIVVRVDPRTGRAAMLSIPRDLYVYVGYVPETDRDYGARKVNTAHALGAAAFPDDTDAGPRLLARVLQSNLEISIHRYIRIDFDGFKKVIDEGLGGLDMNLPPSKADPTVSLVDSNFPDGRCGTMTVRFEPGPQHLNGEQVLQYARSRYSSSDFDRSRRQMEVLMALRGAAKSPAVIPRLHRLVPSLLAAVDTDLTTSEILSLAPLARGMDPTSIVSLRIDENVVYDDTVMVDGLAMSVLRQRPEAWDEVRDGFMAMELPPEPTPTAATSAVDAVP